MRTTITGPRSGDGQFACALSLRVTLMRSIVPMKSGLRPLGDGVTGHVPTIAYLAWLGLALLPSDVLAAATDVRLVLAVKGQNANAARELVAKSVDVNTSQPDGTTALHWAAYWD